MRYSKRYIFFTVILILAFFLKLNRWNDEYSEVKNFRGAQLEEEVFYPLIAKNVNETGMACLNLDGMLYTSLTADILVNEKMQLMLSVPFIRQAFDCSARIYQGETLEIDRGKNTYRFELNKSEGTRNGMPYTLLAPMVQREGQYYVTLEDLCNLFDYAYSWDEATYMATADKNSDSAVKLPSSYDLRKKQRTAAIKNQGTSATCWAYAALGALESSLLPEVEQSYSTKQMVKDNYYNIDASLGGDYTMAAAYFLSWKGPVTEGKNKPDKHVQEVHFYDKEDIDDIKWAVYQNGGVSTSIYANVSTSNLSKSTYYNKTSNSYCYLGTNQPNHDVVIIGWDDDYSKNNFSSPVSGDGAFICQNSWGSEFGEKGIFYVSYYDANIGAQSVSYCGIESPDNYDAIYQSDLCGWVGQLGYNKETITVANVFEAGANENVEAAGFYALDKNTEYQVFFVPYYENTASLAKRQLVASGVVQDAGYYTVKFQTSWPVLKGERFAVVLSIKTPGSVHPMAIEYQSGDMTKNVDITDGEGYMSKNGLDWESVEEKAKGNLCLKAYSSKAQE